MSTGAKWAIGVVVVVLVALWIHNSDANNPCSSVNGGGKGIAACDVRDLPEVPAGADH